MKWVDRCIANRLAIYLLACALCLGGLFCLFVVPVAPFPTMASSGFQIHFNYPGASADTVQKQVVSKVVTALQSVQNISQVQGFSKNSSARLQVKLNSNADLDVMQTQIRIGQAIAAAHLPTAVGQAQISHSEWNAWLINYLLVSDKLSLFQVGNFIKAKLVPVFSSIPGAYSETDAEDGVVRIALQPQALAEHHIDPTQLSGQIDDAFSAKALGQLYINRQSYLLGFRHSIHSIDDFKNLVIGYRGQGNTLAATHNTTAPGANSAAVLAAGSPLRLSDIAHINFTPRQLLTDDYSSVNGHPARYIMLETHSSANPFQVERVTHDYLQQITPRLPADLKVIQTYNAADDMRQSFNEVLLTVLISSALVLLIALIFLGRLRLTLVPIITIPICLLAAVIFITVLGLSLNILTLLAMVIAVGLVVDDAIVVMENISRYIEEGMEKQQALWKGTSDIALTIVGITATLLAVYLPISFIKGSAFISMLAAFALPLAAAVFVSGILALTLTPVMCAQLIKSTHPNAYQLSFAKLLRIIVNGYHAVLKKLLGWPFLSLFFFAVLIAIGAYFAMQLPRRYFPNDPNGHLSVRIRASAQDDVDSLKAKLAQFAPFYKSSKVQLYSVQIGEKDDGAGQLMAELDLQYKPQYLQQLPELTQQVSDFITLHHLQKTNAHMDLSANMGGNYDLSFQVYAAGDAARVAQSARLLTQIMKKSPLFVDPNNDIPKLKKQFAFDINSVQAARFGISHQTLQQMLATYFAGYGLRNDFDIAGLTVPVLVQLSPEGMQDPNILQQLQVRSPQTGRYYPLSQFISLNMVAKSDRVTTMDNDPMIELRANLAPGISFAQAIPFVDHMMAAHAPSLSYVYEYDALRYVNSNSETLWIVILGLLSIYFLLAILFRHLIDPIIILLTVPFSIVGGAVSLYLVNGSLNLYSTLALITLIGLITKHGVLIVQFANRQLQSGMSVMDAILTATHDRFRPIVMTTLAMSLGALPLALSSSQGYVARQALGVVLMGGLLIGTIFSLFIVPLVYNLVKKAEHAAGKHVHEAGQSQH